VLGKANGVKEKPKEKKGNIQLTRNNYLETVNLECGRC
jgi:hypothetical protein